MESNFTVIPLSISNDELTLEYDDIVILRFCPGNESIIPDLESIGEYIRVNTSVNIIDNDSKCVQSPTWTQ